MGTSELPRSDRVRLRGLGFRFHVPRDPSAAGAMVPVASGIGVQKGADPGSRHPRTLVHCCSEKGNLLSRPYLPGGAQKFVDITKEDDFTTDKGFMKTISHVQGPQDTLFFCSPCTGGSAWNRFNEAKAKEKGWTQTLIKIEGHWKLH